MSEDRWQKQTSFGGPDSDDPGNCWACCIAGLLGISLSDVPIGLGHIEDSDERHEKQLSFLRKYGYALVVWKTTDWTEENWKFFWYTTAGALIHVGGPSPRGNWSHSAVYQNGELFFDPHPSEDGILGIHDVEFLIPLDPIKES